MIVEEEILPGILVDIPEPGNKYYPQWHGAFNRSIGLGESLIAGNERAYYGKFLEESSGKNQINPASIEKYLRATLMKSNLKAHWAITELVK